MDLYIDGLDATGLCAWEKGSNMFCYAENIPSQMGRLFQELRNADYLRNTSAPEFAAGAAHFLAELNAIHPFREGNGRTPLVFISLLAQNAGHALDLGRLKPKVFLKAIIRSFAGQEAPLARELKRLIVSNKHAP